MKSYLLLFLFCILIQPSLNAQEKVGIELYKYFKTEPGFQPILHIQSADDWYAELRYNYEDASTLSLYGGKVFSVEGDVYCHITPMAGFSTGRFTGVSFAFNADAEWKNIFLSSQSQYSMAARKKNSINVKGNAESFFFSWSELGYNLSDHFFTGLAIQYTRGSHENVFDRGFLAGLNFKNLSFPFYAFNPFGPGRYFIAGVNYEFTFKKKKPLLAITRLHL